jgi:hypothetical protein
MIVPKAPRRWRRIWLYVGILVGSMLCCIVGLCLVAHFAGERDLALALAETDRLDPNWRLEDLEAHRRPMPPPGENAYEQVIAGTRGLPSRFSLEPFFPETMDGSRTYRLRADTALRNSLEQHVRLTATLLNEDQARFLRAQFTRVKSTMEMLRRLVDYSSGRGPALAPSHGSVAQVPSPFSNVLQSAKILLYDARVRILDGDITGALHNSRAVLHMSRAFEDEPDINLQKMRHNLDIYAIDILEQALAGGIASDPELAELQRDLEYEAASGMEWVGLRGHRAVLDRLLEDAQSGVIGKEDFRSKVHQFGSGPRNSMIYPPLVDNIRFFLLYGNLSGERAKELRRNNELIAIGTLPAAERGATILKFIAELEHSSAMRPTLNETFLDSLRLHARYLEDEINDEAMVSCAIVALAAERYRLVNGLWPENLDQLLDKYLKALPVDPFSGLPLKLARKGTTLVIYSIGPDLKDNGGTIAPSVGPTGPDEGVILHDPPQRRRPGAPFEFPKHEDSDRVRDQKWMETKKMMEATKAAGAKN